MKLLPTFHHPPGKSNHTLSMNPSASSLRPSPPFTNGGEGGPRPEEQAAPLCAFETLWQTRRAFTLIELLVVIAIIGVLAALIIPVAGSVGRVKKINTAQAELQQLETALENYKAKYGVYPPSNASGVVTNALFYELTGVTNTGSYYQPLDGSASVVVSDYTGRFSLGGVVNCSKGGGEDTVYAKDFLPGLKANEIASTTNGSGSTFFYLVTSVSGPDITYQPMPGYTFNPFRYLYPGINNPNSYDLWVKLVINGQTNLVSNWSQQVQHNTSLP